MYKVAFFVPKDFAEKVKMAMFEKGGGKIGNYDCCSFESEGVGQFRPLKGSRPFLGEHDKVEKVLELKVEMCCEDRFVKDVLKAMKESHPYEEVAFDLIRLESL